MERRQPDVDGDERTMLEQYMDLHRATILWKAEGLTDEQLAMTTAASDLTLAGLLKHLALVEDHWFSHMLLGVDPEPLWRDVDWESDPDWEFRTARGEPATELATRYREACQASRAAVASVESLDAMSVRTSTRTGKPYTLRWIMLHMIAETARHNGHADLLREAIDGAKGE